VVALEQAHEPTRHDQFQVAEQPLGIAARPGEQPRRRRTPIPAPPRLVSTLVSNVLAGGQTRRGHLGTDLLQQVVRRDRIGEGLVRQHQTVAGDIEKALGNVVRHRVRPAPQQRQRAGGGHAASVARGLARVGDVRRQVGKPGAGGSRVACTIRAAYSMIRGVDEHVVGRGLEHHQLPPGSGWHPPAGRHRHALDDRHLLGQGRVGHDDLHQEAVALRLGPADTRLRFSIGFWVAMTMNGAGSGWVTPPMDTCRSAITSKSADWTFAGRG